MRKPFERLFASKTVVAKLIELGYLNDMPILTNKTVRVALESYRRTSAAMRQFKLAFKDATTTFELNRDNR